MFFLNRLFKILDSFSYLLFSSFYLLNFVDDTDIDVEQSKRYIQESEKKLAEVEAELCAYKFFEQEFYYE